MRGKTVYLSDYECKITIKALSHMRSALHTLRGIDSYIIEIDDDVLTEVMHDMSAIILKLIGSPPF